MQYNGCLNSLTFLHDSIFQFISKFIQEIKDICIPKNSLNYICNIIADKSLPSEPHSLAHHSTRGKGNHKRKNFKKKQSFKPSNKNTVIAYGNASIQATMKKNTPAPIKVIMQKPICNILVIKSF